MATGMDLVDRLADLTQPWASLYNDSPALQTTVTFLHLAGIFLGGGFAIATDRETFIALRAARLSGQIRHLAHLHTIHRPVLVGLVLALSSGFLLWAADVETFARSTGVLAEDGPPRSPPGERIPVWPGPRPRSGRARPTHRRSGPASVTSPRQAWRSGSASSSPARC